MAMSRCSRRRQLGHNTRLCISGTIDRERDSLLQQPLPNNGRGCFLSLRDFSKNGTLDKLIKKVFAY